MYGHIYRACMVYGWWNNFHNTSNNKTGLLDYVHKNISKLQLTVDWYILHVEEM